MKKPNIIILLSLFFIAPYIQAEIMPQMESTRAYTEQEENTGFFSFGIGGEVIPADYFSYYTTVFNFRYGGIISKQSSFTAGLKLTIHNVTHSFLAFQYLYSFTEGHKWVPGIDISLLIGFQRAKPPLFMASSHKVVSFIEDEYHLSGGLELGPYLKTFISKSHALLLRTGVTIDTTTWKDGPCWTDFRAYLNLAIQWYF
ncbi:MAG: hypothetical protein OXM55_08160 [Bdellovibrionales bacterium]|nr:hypothetical protein [Bdellovibrionales bacterium]